LAESVIEAFEKETGHTIKQVIFYSNFERDQILGGNTVSKFDLVIMNHVSIDLFENNNILAASQIYVLDPDKSIDRRRRDSCQNFGLSYSCGTLGIAYRTDKITQEPTSWSD
jgi:spermidine/putrescine transport system substrate-binding protein